MRAAARLQGLEPFPTPALLRHTLGSASPAAASLNPVSLNHPYQSQTRSGHLLRHLQPHPCSLEGQIQGQQAPHCLPLSSPHPALSSQTQVHVTSTLAGFWIY